MTREIKGLDWLVQLENATLTTAPASNAENITGTAVDVACTPASIMAALAALAFPIAMTDLDPSCSSIRIGDWKALQAAGNAVLFASRMNVNSDGQLDVMAVFGESTSDLTGAYSAKAGRFRHLIYAAADTVFGHETYGAVGQLVVKNGSLNHYHAGLMGTFETNTLCHIQTSYGAAAVAARLGGAGTTVESGGLLAGFLAVQHMSAFTATGTLAAFATHKTSVGIAWPIGLYMQSGSVTKIAALTGASDGLFVTVSALTAGNAYSGIRSTVAAAAASNAYGLAGYFDTTISGTLAGNAYGLGSWVNIAASAVLGSNDIRALDIGVYDAGAAASTSSFVYGLAIETMIAAATNPAQHAMMRFNTDQAGDLPTHWFVAANPECVVYTANTTHTTSATSKVGAIKIAINGSSAATGYIYVYSSAGA